MKIEIDLNLFGIIDSKTNIKNYKSHVKSLFNVLLI